MILFKRSGVCSAVLTFCLTFAGQASQAADLGAPPPLNSQPPVLAYDFWNSPHLLGDWGGLRTRLHNEGVDFKIGYVSEAVANLTGGTGSHAADAGQFAFTTILDLGRIAGDNGGTFQMTLNERSGANLNAVSNTGALQLINEVYGRGDIVRLTQFWFDQKLANDQIDFKIGRVTVGEDFAAFSCDFINLTFCGGDPGNIRGDFVFNYPVSQWGTRVKVNISNFGYAQFGAYDINPNYLRLAPQYATLPTFPAGSTGVMLAGEVAWLPTFGKLAGSYKVGFLYDTSTSNDVFYNTANQPLVVAGGIPRADQGRYAGYINFKQQLTADPTGQDLQHGLFAFLNAVHSDPQTATTDYQIAGGLLYHGPFASRPNDDVGFAIGTTHVNSRIALAEGISGVGYTQSGELTTELFYGYQATGWLNIKGDLQFIHNPGGYNNYGHFQDVFVTGVRATVDF